MSGPQCTASAINSGTLRDAARLPDESVGSTRGLGTLLGKAKLQMHQYGRGKDYLRILAEDLAASGNIRASIHSPPFTRCQKQQ